jgi:trigger factor
MDITITPKDATGAERHLDVSIPAEAVAAAEDKTAQRYTSRAQLPGFRPGKAPAGMVRKRFAQEIRQEAVQALVQDAYQQFMEGDGKQLDLVAQPHVHDLKADPGQPLTFTFHFEVRPEVKLDKVEGFTVTRRPAAVTDDMVTQQLEQLREQRAAWAPVELLPQDADQVTLDLSVQEGDEPGEDGQPVMSAPQQFQVVIGQNQAIPAVEALIRRAGPGETVEEDVTWPEDFPVEEERGKSKRVRVLVKEVKRKALPPLDDDLARELGDFDSLDALTQTVRADLGAQLSRETDAEARSALLDQIIDANPFDVPPSWVGQLVQGYAKAYQIPEQDGQRFFQEFRPLAERQVRRDLVVDAIAKRENLTATAADVDAEVESMAQARGVEVGQLYAQLEKGKRLGELEHGVTERKVFEWLMARNTMEEGQPEAEGGAQASGDQPAEPAAEGSAAAPAE